MQGIAHLGVYKTIYNYINRIIVEREAKQPQHII
jgi:hypothetical protein